MARTKISEFSATPGDNTDIDGIDIAEGCAPSGINNAIRELMAQLKDMQTGASGDTFTLTTVNSTTVDTTNLEATNLKAKDGTAAGSIANSTGVVTLASTVLTTTDINGGTVDGTTIGASSASTGAFTTLASNGATTFTAGTASTSTTTGTAVITGGLGVSGRINAANFDGIVGANTAAAVSSTNLAYTGTLTGGTGVVNIGSGQVYKDASGNVGIGTSSPSYKLHVTGGSVFTSLTNSYYCYTSDFGMGTPDSDGLQLFAGDTNSIRFGNRISGTYSEHARINSSGNLLVGGTTASALRIYSKGANTASSGYSFLAENSAGTLMFYIRNDGLVSTGVGSVSPYNNTTGVAVNMVVGSDGILYRSTSSLKYKTDVNEATHGLADLLMLRPVTYKGKNDGDTVFGGLIAEEVHEAGLTEFVQYANDGSPDALAYGNMVSLCIKAIQEQQALIADLTTRLTALEGN